MKRFVSIAFILSAILLISGCEEDVLGVYKFNLQDLVNKEWALYSAGKENWNGGIAVRILSPKGDFFVSAGMGDNVTENIHFRSASTTKTFTAASIMLLQQKGLLNIEDKITNTIPGSTEAHVPGPDL